MFKKLLIGVLILLALLIGGAFLLPSKVAVERDIEIAASAEEIWPHISDFNRFNAWSPWYELDESMDQTFTGEPGVGQKMTWKSNQKNVGAGSNEMVEWVENERVMTALDFGDMGTARSWITIEPSGAGSKVAWGFDTELGSNPMMRWMGLMFDSWVGADYERGLGKLKALVEAES